MPELPLRRRPQVKKREIARSKRIGPVSGFKWLRNVEDAYRARAAFLEKYNPKTRAAIYALGLQKYVMPKEFKYVRFRLSQNSLAINIFVKSPPQQLAGLSLSKYVPGIGKVYFNVMLENPEVILHEEAHTNTFLGRHYINPDNIKTLENLRESLLSELISTIAQNPESKNLKLEYDGINAVLQLDLFFNRYLVANKIKRKNAEREYNLLFSEIQRVQQIISDSLTFLTPQEILLVLRQTTWGKIPKALEEYIRAKRQYKIKRWRKRKV